MIGKKIQEVRLVVVGRGQMLGEEDVICERNYTKAVTCVSNRG